MSYRRWCAKYIFSLSCVIIHRFYNKLVISKMFQINWDPSIPEIQLFQILILKIQGKGYGWGSRPSVVHDVLSNDILTFSKNSNFGIKKKRLNMQHIFWTWLTHWGRVTHICVGNLTIIGQRQAIIWTIAGILLIWPLGTNFREILFEIHTFPFKKMQLKMSSVKWRPFCLSLNVLIRCVNMKWIR